MTCTGVAGGSWRATVTEWGAVVPWDGSSAIDWFIAADDRWHRPQHETATRQTTMEGTPVVETRVRIPTGDAVQRVYSIADAGGLTIIEVTNDSTLPMAVAFTGGGLLSRRPPASTPPQGIELPADAVIFPVGHHATITVARAHVGAGLSMPDTVPSAAQVVRGWQAQTERASRLRLPDASLAQSVTAARCELLLNGPSGDDDPSAMLLGIAELVRLGQTPAIWVPKIAAVLERLARSGAAIAAGVLDGAARVLHAAGEHRAVDDLRRLVVSSAADSEAMPTSPGSVPAWVERQLVTSDDFAARLLPGGFDPAWLGVDFEAHGLAIGLASHLSFAIRWHGDRPAVLWEITGPPMSLRYDDWSTVELTGEALWPPPTTQRL
jgi:hypothetical protein